jgi:flagellar hook protein FlgE
VTTERDSSTSNTRLITRLVLTVVGMFTFGWLLVPIYDVFCEWTGLNGKTGGPYAYEADSAEVDTTRLVTVQFTASMPSNTLIEVSYFMSPTAAAPNVNSGTFTFDSSGMMSTNVAPSIDFAVPGADPVKVDLMLLGGVGGFTQYASTASTPVLRDQNGYPSGSLEKFSIDRTGLITGSLPSGGTAALARIVLADFNNPSGLLRVGDNMLQESGNSGSAQLGFALEGSQSQLSSGALEMSNVDLAQEFTNMYMGHGGEFFKPGTAEVAINATAKSNIHDVYETVSFISHIMTLVPGDVIATGTPAGVGWSRKPQWFMKPGDVCEVEIEGIGTLVNPIAAQT